MRKYDRLAFHFEHPRGNTELSGGPWAASVLETAWHRGPTQKSGHFTVLHLSVEKRPGHLRSVSHAPYACVQRPHATGGRSPHSLLEPPRLPLCAHPDYEAVAHREAAAAPGAAEERSGPAPRCGSSGLAYR